MAQGIVYEEDGRIFRGSGGGCGVLRVPALERDAPFSSLPTGTNREGQRRGKRRQDTSPVEPNTRYVVVVISGNAKYSGEFQVQSKNDYPITLRPGQKIRFRASQEQMFACDVHAVMMLVTSTYLVMRDPQGKDWYLFVSGGLPPDFNADLRQGSAFDDVSPH
jgi:hypothetical protein